MRATRAGRLAGALAAVSMVAGCGEDEGGWAPLAWEKPPVAYRPASLPNDRVVVARVRNRSSQTVRLEAAKFVLRDADNHVLRGSARFVPTFVHGLYGAFQRPDPLPESEQRRLGLLATIAPGRTAPLTVAWRLTGAARQPITLDYGRGRLKLPIRSRVSR